jgi:hypothetical protein
MLPPAGGLTYAAPERPDLLLMPLGESPKASPGDSNANGVVGADRNGVAHGGLSSPIESDATSSEALKPFQGQYLRFSVACPWLESRVPDSTIRELSVVFQYSRSGLPEHVNGSVMGVAYGYLVDSVGKGGHLGFTGQLPE